MPGCGARGRWRAWPDNEPRRRTARQHTRPHRCGGRRRAPEGTGGLRGAAPNEVRSPSLAGGRAIRRPEHPWRPTTTRTRRPRRAAHAGTVRGTG